MIKLRVPACLKLCMYRVLSEVQTADSIVLWSGKNCQGDYETVVDSTKHLATRSLVKGIGSLEVVGTSSHLLPIQGCQSSAEPRISAFLHQNITSEIV